jgi:shikimate dehydrogenase
LCRRNRRILVEFLAKHPQEIGVEKVMGDWKEIGPAAPPKSRIAVIATADSASMAALARVCLADANIEADCIELDIPVSESRSCIQHLKEQGLRGALVCGPHRVEAAQMAERFSMARLSMGVANVLSFKAGIFAQNTEITALSHLLRPMEPGRALILGSGAGARSVVAALYDANWSVRVWNRNPTKLRPLRSLFARYGNVELVYTPDPTDCRLVVNCTPLGSKVGECPPLDWNSVRPKTVFIDFVVRRVATDFLRTARSKGLQVIDGRQIVVESTASALEWLFDGTMPRGKMLELLGLKTGYQGGPAPAPYTTSSRFL